MNIENRSRGCMIAAAYGDMLGAAVEFSGLASIRSQFGLNGITVPQPAFGFPHPIITDDTQMAIATARGVVKSMETGKLNDREILQQIWMEYLKWYDSQNQPGESRAPGTTCMGALARGSMGTTQLRINNSAGCGGIMRVHPIGVAFNGNQRRAFVLGAEAAARTHGNPLAFIPAGILAAIIAAIMRGSEFFGAVRSSFVIAEEIFPREIELMHETISTSMYTEVTNDPAETIDRHIGRTPGMGGGWLGHDALAIALYAIRCAPNNPLMAVNIAVNHSGDSDSTGSIAGSIVGAMYGPNVFLNHLNSYQVSLERQAELEELSLKLIGSKG